MMFKNMLKRAGLSTVRKLGRTVVLVAILFVMANLILATVAIRNSVGQSMQAAKDRLDATVNLTVDSEKLQEQMAAARENAGTEGAEAASFTTPTITEELARGISESEYLKDYSYSVSATANAAGFEVVTTAQNERERQFRDAFSNAQDSINDAQNQAAQNQRQLDESVREFNGSDSGDRPGGSGLNGAGGGRQFGGFQMNFNIANVADPTLMTGDTTIQGINAYNFISEVEAGAMTLVEGAAFDEGSEGGVIISRELADANSLAVGGAITLKTVADETEVELAILGIYQATGEDFNDNTVYMNIETAKRFFSAEQLEKLSVTNVKYYLTAAADKDAFLEWAAAEYPSMAEEGLKLDVDTSTYDTMVGPIERVGGFATTVMWIVVAASVVIISLIVVVNIRDRRYEMGVLVSLGSKKVGILGQILVELVLVGTVGFVLSLATAGVVADKLGEGMMAGSGSSSTGAEVATTEAGTMGGGMMGRGRSAASGNVTQITSVDVRASAGDYATLFGVIYAILIVAMVVPSINILRYQPKTILAGKE
jgi:putative ABC transport system permease protein